MNSTIRTAADLEDALVRALNWGDNDAWEALEDGIRDVGAYSDHGILTRDRGLVVRMSNGAEFQVTVVGSGRPDDPGYECPDCGDEQEALQDFLGHMVDDHDWDELDAIDAAGTLR